MGYTLTHRLITHLFSTNPCFILFQYYNASYYICSHKKTYFPITRVSVYNLHNLVILAVSYENRHAVTTLPFTNSVKHSINETSETPLCRLCGDSTPHLKKRMHDRDILKLKALHSNVSNDWLAFKGCRNSVNAEIKQTKKSYYKNALHANEGDSRQT